MARDDHDMAVDAQGRPIAMAPADVRKMVLDMIDTGELVAVVIRRGDEIGVQVMGPPSRELLRVLKAATRAYEVVLKGH